MQTLEETIESLLTEYKNGAFTDRYISSVVRKYYQALNGDYFTGRRFYKKLKEMNVQNTAAMIQPSRNAESAMESINSKMKRANEIASEVVRLDAIKYSDRRQKLAEELQEMMPELEKQGAGYFKEMDEFDKNIKAFSIELALMDDSLIAIKILRIKKWLNGFVYFLLRYFLTLCFYSVSFYIGYKLELLPFLLKKTNFATGDMAFKILIFISGVIIVDGLLSKVKKMFIKSITVYSLKGILKMNNERNTLLYYLEIIRKKFPEI